MVYTGVPKVSHMAPLEVISCKGGSLFEIYTRYSGVGYKEQKKVLG